LENHEWTWRGGAATKAGTVIMNHKGTERTKINPLVETTSGFISYQADAARAARCIAQIDSLCASVSLW
jgi:hypothetical protein